MQHSIALLLGQIALTQPGGVLGHCPVEKQMIVILKISHLDSSDQRTDFHTLLVFLGPSKSLLLIGVL